MTNETTSEETTTGEPGDAAAVADAEIIALKESIAALETELAEARSAQQLACAEALELRGSLDAAQAGGNDAARKYREARLAAAPQVPPELVPDSGDIAEIDRGMDAALRVVAQVRERVQKETDTPPHGPRVPAGAPPRRAPDLSLVSASEKIRIGLERPTDNHGR